MITHVLYDINAWSFILMIVLVFIIMTSFCVIIEANLKSAHITFFIGLIGLSLLTCYESYTYYTGNQKPIYDNFTVVRMNGHLKLDSKNSHYKSVILPIADETDQDYSVNYQGKVYTVPKNP